NGRYCVTCVRRKRCTPCTTRRSDPSGNLNILWMWVSVPRRKSSLSTGSSTAGSRWVTTPITFRSRTASFTRATELSRATASGRMAGGNSSVSRSGSSPSSPGTSLRSTSCTPPDSKSGARSSLGSLISFFPARGGNGASARLRGTQLLEEFRFGAPHLLADVLLALLAVPAQCGKGHGGETGLGDLLTALGAGPVGTLVEADHGLVDLGQRLRFHLHERQLDVLDEVVHALLLGVLDLGHLRGQRLPQRTQLGLDLVPPGLEHGLQDAIPLTVGGRRRLVVDPRPWSLLAVSPARTVASPHV